MYRHVIDTSFLVDKTETRLQMTLMTLMVNYPSETLPLTSESCISLPLSGFICIFSLVLWLIVCSWDNLFLLGICRIARWGKMSPLSTNESMSAIEYAMRNSGSQEHMFLPKVGQTFPSLGDAHQLYNQLYNLYSCFSIRKENNKNKSNFLIEDGQKFKIMQEYNVEDQCLVLF